MAVHKAFTHLQCEHYQQVALFFLTQIAHIDVKV